MLPHGDKAPLGAFFMAAVSAAGLSFIPLCATKGKYK